MVTIGTRLKQIMEIRHITQVEIIKLAKPLCEKEGVKLTKPKLSQYVNDKFEPDQEMIYFLSRVLDVNPAWLAGWDAPIKAIAPTGEDTADERMEKLKELFPRLSPFDQRRFLADLEERASDL